MIHFLSPGWLLAWFVVAALAACYVVLQFQRSKFAVRFSNVALLKSIAPRSPGWRRHVPAAALLLALAVLIGGMARPAHDVRVPVERATVVLAIDVSLSMTATDVAPDRFAAAKSAAKSFVDQLPDGYNVALVSFAGTANAVVPATKDHRQVSTAIDGLQLRESTAIGEAIYSALDVIANVPADGAREPAPAHIVLLSDGSTTVGRPNEEAAGEAVRKHVGVSTIAFGTQGGFVEMDGMLIPVPVDVAALTEVAQRTGGRHYTAETATELKDVYRDLGSSLGHRTETRGVTQWFLGIGLLFALVSAALSLLWTQRLP